MKDRRTRGIVYFCFLISGAAGLIYEVVWARQLTLFLGITTYAHTAVITAFLAGLAAGAVTIGRLADRRHDSLRLYAWLEVGVGLYGAATPWLFPTLQILYAATASSLGLSGATSHLLRFVLALAALLVPTFLMGGTLPLLVRGLTENLPRLAGVVGRLYGINTLGATLGTFAAGYLLLPALGIRGTILVAAALNLGVAAVVLSLKRRKVRAPARKRGKAPGKSASQELRSGALSAPLARILLIGFAISGFAALIYQIAWIRALTLVIGSSVYGFSATLTTFLAGLAIGSLVYGRYLAGGEGPRGSTSAGRALGQAAVLEVAIGLAALFGLPLIGRLPELFLWGYGAGLHHSFFLFQLFIFSLCFLVILLPTLLLGALFPLIAALWTRDVEGFGRGVGTAYAANTAGTILGALGGGLLLLPTLGIHNGIVLASAVHVAVGALFWTLRPGPTAPARRTAGAAAALAVFALAVWAIPPWDRALMTSGVFYRPDKLHRRPAGKSLRDVMGARDLLYYREGIDGTVAVMESGPDRVLMINGKADASNRFDLPTQTMCGQLPMLMHPDPREVLIIGLGSGITVHSAATHPAAEHISVVEVSPEVVAASAFFAAENGDVLADPRVELILGDARNTLLADRRTYDVIISQPSNPWISGISNLFTREFFELASSRLAAGGIMAQWFQIYGMSNADLKTVLKTYQAVFPHTTVWIPKPGDLILLGSITPHALDYARVEASLARPAIRQDLERGGIPGIRQLAQTFLLGGSELAELTAGAVLNTDDRPQIEFNAPRNIYAETSQQNMADIVRHRQGRPLAVPIAGMVTATEEGLDAPAMGLVVGTAEPPADGSWQALWLVLLEQRGDDFSTSSQRLLVWREREIETRVQAVSLAAPPTPSELPGYLSSQLEGRMVDSGTAQLPGGGQGLWGWARDRTARQLELAMVWTCTSVAGELTRYTAYRRQPDPGDQGLLPAVLDLASRFRCR